MGVAIILINGKKSTRTIVFLSRMMLIDYLVLKEGTPKKVVLHVLVNMES